MTRTSSQYLTEQASDERGMQHRVVAVDRRRTTCTVLAEYDEGPVSLETVAEAVASRDCDVEEGSDGVEDVAISLHHLHLPLLASAGVLEYDATGKRVRPDPETLAQYVD